VIWRWLAPVAAMNRVVHEDELSASGEQCSHGNKPVQRNERLRVVVHKRLVTPHIPSHAQVMERHEDAICADEAAPEVDLPQGFIHHSSKLLAEPILGTSKGPEPPLHTHHTVEV